MAGSSKLCSKCPEDHFEKATFFQKVLEIYSSYRTLINIFRTFGDDFPAGLSKLYSGCSQEHFEEIDFWRNFQCFWHYSILNKNFSDLWQSFLSILSKLYSSYPEEQLEVKRIFKKKIFRHFWILTEIFIDLRQELFPWGCESFTLRVQRNKLWMKFFLPLSDTEQTKFGLQRNYSNRFLKTAFYLSRATSEKTDFMGKRLAIKFRNLHKRFWALAESFWQRFLDCTVRVHDNDFRLSVKYQVFQYVRFLNDFFNQFLAELCQCCFLIVLWNILMWKNFEKKKDLTCSNSEELFSINCVKQSRAGLSKLNSACPD